MELTGAQILLESLKREGVDTLFGYPGGAIIDIYDALSRCEGLSHILVRHEQAAVHAADGYARASGKVGACLVTSGPGATNTVTGIATAYCDSIPLVVVTGQVPTRLIGNDAFQEVDIVGITRPCTKHNYLIKDVNDITKVVRQAFYLARSGRPGPVLIDFPRDVSLAKTKFVWPEDVQMRTYNPTYKPNRNQVRRTTELLKQAKRPLILAGGGVLMSDAGEVLSKLAKDLHIPVCSSLMGLGSFPGDDPLWLGMLGMHGSVFGNKAASTADLILAVGTRFADRVTGNLAAFGAKAKIVHIDIDPTSIRKNVQVAVPLVSDCKQALEAIAEMLTATDEQIDWAAKHKQWLQQVHTWREEYPTRYIPAAAGELPKPQQVLEVVNSIFQGDVIVTTEVGQHQMWAAQFLHFKQPRTFLTSGGLGTMGFGLPAAVGAQFAFPDKHVLLIAGDGSLQMNIQEFATIAQNKLPIKVLILNNGYLGMVRQWQELFFNKVYQSTDMSDCNQPDFVKIADAYGIAGYRIEKQEDVFSILQKALTAPGAAIIDVRIEREENVFPMVPSGAALHEMIGVNGSLT